MYTDEKVVLKNHMMAAVKRLLSHGDVDGSADNAMICLKVGQWLDTVKTEPRPAPKPKK